MTDLLKKYFPEISEQQIAQFAQLPALYKDWNAKINVISRKDMPNFAERHVLHSLAIAKVMSFKAGAKVLDVGTGGGFPAIPLAILF
ncbi:MAG: 16S rRNA (guanine(527)-N(7))-methyltransferase RsmG, partial [Bacteroidetes bacterium]